MPPVLALVAVHAHARRHVCGQARSNAQLVFAAVRVQRCARRRARLARARRGAYLRRAPCLPLRAHICAHSSLASRSALRPAHARCGAHPRLTSCLRSSALNAHFALAAVRDHNGFAISATPAVVHARLKLVALHTHATPLKLVAVHTQARPQACCGAYEVRTQQCGRSHSSRARVRGGPCSTMRLASLQPGSRSRRSMPTRAPGVGCAHLRTRARGGPRSAKRPALRPGLCPWRAEFGMWLALLQPGSRLRRYTRAPAH
jgi:hypothetical protein